MITTTDAWLSILHLSLLFCRCLLECCHFWKGLWIVIQWKELPPLNFLIILSFVAQQTLHLLLTWWKVSDIVFASQEELNRKYKDFSPSKANFSSECWSLWFFHNLTCPPSSLGNKSYRLGFSQLYLPMMATVGCPKCGLQSNTGLLSVGLYLPILGPKKFVLIRRWPY